VVAGAGWFAIVGMTLRHSPLAAAEALGAHTQTGVMVALALPLMGLGIVVESLVAWGLGGFLARVHPGLLPGTPATRRGAEGLP